jgi:NAD(P)-dependent dehydrogenase (short-subunit alcohol dehydrogenase family)
MGRVMLNGQTILVTGATGAIGQAICQCLAAEGARVVIHYGRNRAAAEDLLQSIGGQGVILSADLSCPDGATGLWDAAVSAEGRITGLVNNAGIRSEVSVEATMADWQAVWEAGLSSRRSTPGTAGRSRRSMLTPREKPSTGWRSWSWLPGWEWGSRR